MSVINTSALAGASGQAAGGDYQIERSLRFNGADSAYLNRTLDATGSGTTGTYSFWIKRSKLLDSGRIINVGNYSAGVGYPTFYIQWNGTNDRLIAYCYYNGDVLNLETDAQFRDTSAWYHVVFKVDTTQATNTNRAAFYVNGVEQTITATTWPDQNDNVLINLDTHPAYIGCRESLSQYLNGYLADLHFIDGQALAASDFGEYDDNNVWKPKKYDGTYGTNGFHLDFSDTSSDSALGTDSSGNSNDWTVNNLSAQEGQMFSTGTVSGAVHSSTTWSAAFDGSFSTGVFTYATNTSTLTLPRPVSWSSKFEIYALQYDGSFFVNGSDASPTWNTPATAAAWYDITSIVGTSGTLTSVGVSDVSANYVKLFAIRLDDTLLVNSTATQDVFRDSPTNGDPANDTGAGGELSGNYCVLNAAVPLQDDSLSDGNLKLIGNYSGLKYPGHVGTIAAPAGTGKWYWEIDIGSAPSYTMLGIVSASEYFDGRNGYAGSEYEGCTVYVGYNGTGYQNVGATVGTSYSALTAATLVGVMFDAGAGTFKLSYNGVEQSTIFTGIPTNKSFAPFITHYGENLTYTFNFGQRPFAYNPPSGYKCLCTANLPDPTIEDPSKHFDVKTFPANNGSQSISLGFSPDLVWTKSRDHSYEGQIFDKVRGNNQEMSPNAVRIDRTLANSLTFDSSGFTMPSTNNNANYTPSNGGGVGWAWEGGDLVTNSAYSQSQTWSDSLTSSTGFRGSEPATSTFDGSTSTTCSAVGSGIVTYTSPVTVSSSETIRVYVNGGTTNVSVNGGSDQAVSAGSFVTLQFDNPSTTPFTLAFQRPGGADTGVKAIEIGGKVLVDAGVIPVGSLNGSVYNQDKNWSGYTKTGSYPGGATWSEAFNGDLADGVYTNTNVTGTLTIDVADRPTWSSKIRIYGIRYGSALIKINGTDVSSSVSNSVGWYDLSSTLGLSGTLESFEIDNPGGNYSKINAVELDGRLLVDTSVTMTNVPSIATTVSANPSAGLSIIKFRGNATDNATVATGLNAPPEFVIQKGLTIANYWAVYHAGYTHPHTRLNLTDQAETSSNYWKSFSSALITLPGAGSTLNNVNNDGEDYIAYCFSPVEGYSAVGSYTGSTGGAFVYTGFKTRWLMIKAVSQSGSWVMYDTARDPGNSGENWLYANSASDEQPAATYEVYTTSNGFRTAGTSAENNGNGVTYIYAAFAEHPFKTARAR